MSLRPWDKGPSLGKSWRGPLLLNPSSPFTSHRAHSFFGSSGCGPSGPVPRTEAPACFLAPAGAPSATAAR
eukprot:6449746-Pyramimonas_sp.AAC.1